MRTKKPETSPATDDIAPPAEELDGALAAEDQELLERASRFLVGIQNAAHLRRARREGYTAQEHALGWRLWTKAAGADRPLEHWLGEQEPEAATDVAYQSAILRELDAFEGLWHPRVRALVERLVPEDEQDDLVAEFFEGIAPEQPPSPALVGRVRSFLDRVEKLAEDDAPGRRDVAAKLVERGLSKETVKSVRGLCVEANGERKEDTKAPAAASPEAVRAATEAQLGALKELRRWFNDWATMLRTALPPRDQTRLGLVAQKTRASAPPKATAGVSDS